MIYIIGEDKDKLIKVSFDNEIIVQFTDDGKSLIFEFNKKLIKDVPCGIVEIKDDEM